MKTIFSHLEWWLFITVPLGHYVPWMEWLTWLNIAPIVILLLFTAYIMMSKMNELMDAYAEAEMGKLANSFKISWKSVVFVLSMALLYVFDWELAAWLIFGCWFVVMCIMQLVRDKHNELVQQKENE